MEKFGNMTFTVRRVNLNEVNEQQSFSNFKQQFKLELLI